MRAEFCETVEVTGHVTVTVEMIEAALAEGISDCELQHESEIRHETDAQKLRRRRQAVGSLANSVHRCLSAITDTMIAEQGADMRRVVAELLAKQSQRWIQEPTDA